MYCPKCGTDNKDDAKFCTKCGSVLTSSSKTNDGSNSSSVSSPANNSNSSAMSQPIAEMSGTATLQETQASVGEKTKLKGKDIAWGVVGIILIAFFIYSLVPKTDWVESVKSKYTPFADEGYKWSIGAVVSKYMSNAKYYASSADGDVHVVKITGSLVGADDFTIEVSMTPAGKDLYNYRLESLSAPNSGYADNYLACAFQSLWPAYENDIAKDEFESYVDSIYFGY